MGYFHVPHQAHKKTPTVVLWDPQPMRNFRETPDNLPWQVHLTIPGGNVPFFTTVFLFGNRFQIPAFDANVFHVSLRPAAFPLCARSTRSASMRMLASAILSTLLLLLNLRKQTISGFAIFREICTRQGKFIADICSACENFADFVCHHCATRFPRNRQYDNHRVLAGNQH